MIEKGRAGEDRVGGILIREDEVRDEVSPQQDVSQNIKKGDIRTSKSISYEVYIY